MDKQKEIFTKIYNENIWNGEESKSGRGSDSAQTARLVIKLKILIQELNIRSMLDCPCGDLNWMKNILKDVSINYIGIDIVDQLIEENKKKYSSYKFESKNAISDLIETPVDLIFCRDMLNHLVFDDVYKVLLNFVNSDSKYIAFTNFKREDRQNVDLRKDCIGWRTINFKKPPFNFPDPVYSFSEGCTEKCGNLTFEDKSVSVWTKEQIKPLIERYFQSTLKRIPIPKKWELEKIPKVVHFFWDSEFMPFLRYATIASFIKQNPDWKVKLYLPKHVSNIKWKTLEHNYDVKGETYFDECLKLPIETVEVDLSKLGFNAELNGVFQSDILRWHILSTEGGLWADMDIIFTKSMNDFHLNKKQNKDIDGTVCVSNQYDRKRFLHTIGFILSSPGNNLYKWMFDQTKKVTNTNNYQCFGADLLNKDFPSVEKINSFFKVNVMNLGLDCCYTYGLGQIQRLHVKGNRLDIIRPDTIAIHWYAGNPVAAKSLNEINHKNFMNYNSPVAEALRLSGI